MGQVSQYFFTVRYVFTLCINLLFFNDAINKYVQGQLVFSSGQMAFSSMINGITYVCI